MLKVIYSKFSNDRNPAYAIRTNILMDEAGRKYVQKVPMSEHSVVHIEQMYQNEQLLKEAYKGTILRPNETLQIEGQTVFAYVQGNSLSDELDLCLEAGETERFYQLFEQYAQLVKNVSDKACNIDLIPDNILVQDDVWNVIDYEWVLKDAVPSDFILYRGIHYYVGDPLDVRKGLKGSDLYAHFGMPDEQITAYKEREEAFQKSLDGDYTKLSTMKYEYNMPIIDLNQLMKRVVEKRQEQEVFVTVSYEDGTQQKQACKLQQKDLDELTFSVSVKMHARTVAISFPYDICYVHIWSLVKFSSEQISLNFTTDGIGYDGNIVKLKKEQSIEILLSDGMPGTVSVHLSCYMTEEVLQAALLQEEHNKKMQAEALALANAQLTKQQSEKERMLSVVGFRQEQIRQMQETPVVHYFGRVLNKLRGYDPVAALRPLLSQEQSGLQFCIDEVGYHVYSLYIRGWVFHQQGLPVSLVIRDEKGKFLDCEIRKNEREDVADVFRIQTSDVCGFSIYVPREQLRTEKVYLEMETIGGYISKEIMAYGDKKSAGDWESRLEHVFEYDEWAKRNLPTQRELKRQRRAKFAYRPLISVVVPLFNTPLDYLETLIRSVLDQTYSNMQLCLADGSTNDIVQNYIAQHYGNDSRVKYKRLTENKGISGNTIEALSLADGDFIMLSDHDDEVMLNACYEMVKALNEDPEIDAVYTDEDKMTMDGMYYFDPHFKPDFNLEFLRSNNYICHIFLVRKSIVDSLGEPFRTKYDGAQDFDFILRCCEKARKVYHVPKIVYHWRSHPLSTAGNPESKDYAYEAGRASVEASYERLNIPATVTRTQYFGRYRTQFHIVGKPLVSVVIDAKDCKDAARLESCVKSVFEMNAYKTVEVLIVGSEKHLPQENGNELLKQFTLVRLVPLPKEGGVYDAYQAGANAAEGAYIVMMNSDVSAKDEHWIEEMLSYCQQKDVGICGGMIVDAQDKVYSGGMVIGMNGSIGHLFTGLDSDEFSFAGWLNSTRDVSALSALCFMVDKAAFESAEGFDRNMGRLGVADLCLKMIQRGARAIYDTYAKVRYDGTSQETYENAEVELFQKRWQGYFKKGDPNYNRNLTLENGLCKPREV